MDELHFMKGNEAAAEAAIRAGCKGYFFYPLTPSSEIGEYMAVHLSKRNGGKFVQAESEVAAINMMFGGASTGTRVMTGTSGCGYSLMSEGISYMTGAEVPAVIVDVMRGGPGLGSLEPTQADYNQVTRGTGHGGHMFPVFAPSNAQEIVDNVTEAFEVSERYRTPVVVLYDGCTGQVMEKVRFPEDQEAPAENSWAFTDGRGRERRVLRSGYAAQIPGHWKHLFEKYDRMKAELQRYESYLCEDADIILVAFGIVARICRSVVNQARAEGLRVGMIRPTIISPFPEKAFEPYRGTGTQFLTVEMSYGEMVHDVTVAVGDASRSHFYRNEFGSRPSAGEILEAVRRMSEEAAR